MKKLITLKVINCAGCVGLVLFVNRNNDYYYWFDPAMDDKFELNECYIFKSYTEEKDFHLELHAIEITKVRTIKYLGDGSIYYPPEADELFYFLRDNYNKPV